MNISHTRPLVIQRDQHTATIYMSQYRINGIIHPPVGGRISDFINYNVHEVPFIPLTDVTVFSVDSGELLFSTEFLAVHRNQISFLTVDKIPPAPADQNNQTRPPAGSSAPY